MSSQWLFPLSTFLNHTPSRETSAIPLEDELRGRTKGVEFISRVAAQLALSDVVVSAATHYFHRFYMRNSMEDYPRQEVAAASVFLATKTEESSRKLKDVAFVCYSKATGGKDESSTEVQRWQKNILATEEILLDALCFDFIVDHPHAELVDLLMAFQARETLEQYAWTLVNDSLRTPLPVLQPPRIIASACFVLAQKIEEGPASSSLDERIFLRSPASLPTPPHMYAQSPLSANFAQEFFHLSELDMEAVAVTITVILEFYAIQDMPDDREFYMRLLADIVPPITPSSYTGLYRLRPNTNVYQPPVNGPTNSNAASPNEGGITPASMGRTPHRSGRTPLPDELPSSPTPAIRDSTPVGELSSSEQAGSRKPTGRAPPLDLS